VINLYIKNQLDALIFQMYSWNENLHISDSSCVHHEEFFTVHTAMAYVIQFWRQLASRIRMELSSTLILSETRIVSFQE